MATLQRRPWHPEEDAALARLVARYGSKRARGMENRWPDIARHLPGRTSKDCRKRWFHSLDPTLRKGRWTAEEDRVLLEAHSRLGPVWHEIAALIPGRKDDQCSKRYAEILDPSVKERLAPWTGEEDAYLVAEVAKIGHRWAAISSGLPGRPPLTCRNRWRTLQHRPRTRPSSETPASSVDANRQIDQVSTSSPQSSDYLPSPSVAEALVDNSFDRYLSDATGDFFESMPGNAAAQTWLEDEAWSEVLQPYQEGIYNPSGLTGESDVPIDPSMTFDYNPVLDSSVMWPHPGLDFGQAMVPTALTNASTDASPATNVTAGFTVQNESGYRGPATTLSTKWANTPTHSGNVVVHEVHHYHHVIHHHYNGSNDNA